MVETKKVSIVVPVYNSEKYLDGCVQSILTQSYPNIELILVNDGSTDRSAEICRKYAAEYENIVCINQENAGVSAARNTGLDSVTGEYVAFVDSDDRIKPDMIKLLVEAIERESADMSICGYEVIRADRVENRGIDREVVSGKREVAEYFALHFEEAIASSVWCKLFRHSLIKHRFDRELSMGEDLFFNLPYVKQMTKVISIPEMLYIYDKSNDGSLTYAYREHYYTQQLFVYRQWLEWLGEFRDVDCVHVHSRIIQNRFARLFGICGLPGKADRISLLKEMWDPSFDASAEKAGSRFDKAHRFILYLLVRRRYGAVLMCGRAYCKVKQKRRGKRGRQ